MKNYSNKHLQDLYKIAKNIGDEDTIRIIDDDYFKDPSHLGRAPTENEIDDPSTFSKVPDEQLLNKLMSYNIKGNSSNIKIVVKSKRTEKDGTINENSIEYQNENKGFDVVTFKNRKKGKSKGLWSIVRKLWPLIIIMVLQLIGLVLKS